MGRAICLRSVVLVFWLFSPLVALAQQIPPSFQVTLTNPGARSTGFGGAFVALADDATAAFANPAGLVQLGSPEISAELRFDVSIDRGAGRVQPDVSGLGFFSFVYPSRRWSLALWGHQLVSADIQLGEGTFEVQNFGVSAAYRLGDALSVGLGASYFDAGLANLGSTDWGFSVGVLWRLTEQWKLGGFYRQGAELDFRLVPALAPDTQNLPLDLPDSYGLGAAFRTRGGHLTLAFEWDRVQYSSILERLDAPGLVADDVDELHLGGEYAILGWRPVLALRAGVWRDPDHRIRMSGESGGDDEISVAMGVGLAFRHLQLDMAVDASDAVSTLSLSVGYGF